MNAFLGRPLAAILASQQDPLWNPRKISGLLVPASAFPGVDPESEVSCPDSKNLHSGLGSPTSPGAVSCPVCSKAMPVILLVGLARGWLFFLGPRCLLWVVSSLTWMTSPSPVRDNNWLSTVWLKYLYLHSLATTFLWLPLLTLSTKQT